MDMIFLSPNSFKQFEVIVYSPRSAKQEYISSAAAGCTTKQL